MNNKEIVKAIIELGIPVVGAQSGRLLSHADIAKIYGVDLSEIHEKDDANTSEKENK